MILSKLTPAETLMVWKGNEATLKDMLKYTMMDLFLKQILMIEDVERQPSKRDPVRVYKYVSIGRNFTSYKHLPHEVVFLSAYQKNSGIRILFRNCVKMGYENAFSESAFCKTIVSSQQLKDSFTRSFMQKLFSGGFSYTNRGVQLKTLVETQIQELEKTLPAQINTDKQKALAILKQIGGNVFLLKGLEFALLKEIDEQLLKELNRTGTNGGCGTGCWTTFDTYDHDFDSSCSSDTVGSACSGDGGCSSGCSGCGGCGGD
jgi:hypothetical protein